MAIVGYLPRHLEEDKGITMCLAICKKAYVQRRNTLIKTELGNSECSL
jgi:hypothetical protein